MALPTVTMVMRETPLSDRELLDAYMDAYMDPKHIPIEPIIKSVKEVIRETSAIPSEFPEIVPSHSATATKYDQGKLPMSLLSRTALEEISKVLQFGANKYSANNWRRGFIWSRTLDAAMRHLHAFADGEDLDPESGLSHLAHLGCNIMFMLEFQKTHPEMDDRYKKED